MIALDVENYCHECGDFDPVCDKLYADNNCVTALVTCVNRARCANLKRYIEEQVARKEKRDESDKS